MRYAAPVMLVALLAGCAGQPARVKEARTDAPDKSYVVELPVGWIQQTTQDKRLMASRDGFLLEEIVIAHRPLKEAFPKTKAAATDSLLPSELAERELAEDKAQDQFLAAATVVSNEPFEISGREGFQLRISYHNNRGLELQRVVYGVADKSGYYRIAFEAPMLYYFDTYYPQFEKVVTSFQLAGGKS